MDPMIDPEVDSIVDFDLENESWTLSEHFYSLSDTSSSPNSEGKENEENLKSHFKLEDVENLMTSTNEFIAPSEFEKGRNLGYFATSSGTTTKVNDYDTENQGRGQRQPMDEEDIEDGEIIDNEDNIDVDVQPATLLLKDKILSFNGTDLSVGFKTSKKILNYDEFHTLKHIEFQKWLVAHKSVLTNTGVNFVCNVGRIANILLTPLQPESPWQFYAVRYNDIIFLFNAAPEGRTPTTVPGHCGIVYKRLVTGENPEVDGVNEFDKAWAVTESRLGNFKLILLTGGQVDVRGRKVNTRTYNPRIFANWRLGNKFLNYWAFTAAAGAQHLLLGTRNHRHILENSELLSLDGIWDRTNLSQFDQARCYFFTEQILGWIQEHFVENDRYHVKHYCWAGMDKWTKKWADDDSVPFAVECNTITDDFACRTISSQILPEFFINGVFQDENRVLRKDGWIE